MVYLKTQRPARIDLFQAAKSQGFGDVHFRFDANTDLQAIIAIQSEKLGATVGGCRCQPYPSTDAAIDDALRLALYEL